LTTLAWGLFLACSWTWCVGMYLPRILLERHGWWGFIAFAIPNIIGCSAFGYLVRNGARSRAMIERHRTAMTWFSIITIAFHIMFLTLLIQWLTPDWSHVWWWRPWLVPIALLIASAMSVLSDRAWLIYAALMYFLSILAFIIIGTRGAEWIDWYGEFGRTPLVYLFPVMIFGFALCPYLDLTFHRAIQLSPSRHSFAIFGITFAAMIVLTCFMWFTPGYASVPLLALGHIVGQSIFTMGAHAREVMQVGAIPLPGSFGSRGRGRRWLLIAAAILAMLAGPIAGQFDNAPAAADDLYLRYLVFYALVFPLYVFLFIGPWRMFDQMRAGRIVYLLLVLLSLPAYELGFIHHEPRLLLIPLSMFAMVLIGTWWIGSRRE
jgi:hypothetical protein